MDGARFTAGYAVGVLAGATVVALLAAGLGQLAAALVPARPREVALGVVLLVLGLLDLGGRTPQLLRQVPQRHALGLPPGWRGLVWGLDLGLLVTTQKTASLLWAALAAAVLAAPAAAAALVPAMVAVLVGQLVVGVALDHVPGRAFLGGERSLVRGIRLVTGVGLLCLGLLQLG